MTVRRADDIALSCSPCTLRSRSNSASRPRRSLTVIGRLATIGSSTSFDVFICALSHRRVRVLAFVISITIKWVTAGRPLALGLPAVRCLTIQPRLTSGSGDDRSATNSGDDANGGDASNRGGGNNLCSEPSKESRLP